MKIPWAEVEIGDIIKGKDGYSWTVTEKVGKRFTLEREGKNPFSGEPSGTVEVISSRRMDEEMAIATTQVVLGGVIIARKMKDGIDLVPSNFPEPGSLLAHAHLYHSAKGDGEATLSTLITWHDELHRATGAGFIQHHHDPDFWRKR